MEWLKSKNTGSEACVVTGRDVMSRAAQARRTLVDVIFDDWFLYCFSFDTQSGGGRCDDSMTLGHEVSVSA